MRFHKGYGHITLLLDVMTKIAVDYSKRSR